MNVVPLEQVSEAIDYGVTASASEIPVGPKFLRITDIQNGAVNWNTVPYCKAPPKKLAASRLKPGDIVFARTGATTGKSFLIRDCPQDSVFASYLIRVRPKPVIDPLFLSFFFDSPSYWTQIQAKAQGAAQPGVNSTKLKELKIPLLPLEEQKRIAAVLDQADSLRRLRQRAIERLNSLGQAIFYEMFGGWNIENLHPVGEFAYVKGGKRLPKGTEYSIKPTSHPYIRVSDMREGSVYWDDMKYIRDDTHEKISRYIVNNGDIIISIAGSIGLTAPVTRDLDGANLTENAAKLVPKSDHVFDPIFMSHALSLPEVQAQIRSKTGKVTIGKLALFRIEQIHVPLPPIDAQEEFSKVIASCKEKSKSFSRHATRTRQLFASLQHRAFRGDL